MPEATSALTFADLILEVAHKGGHGSYGLDGAGALAVPEDAHDLAFCKRMVDHAIRMFINDAPHPNGWRWLRPTASITIWGNQNATASKTVTSGGMVNGVTTLVANVDSFYETMELHDIDLTDIGSFEIRRYVSPTTIEVVGDATSAAATQWAIVADGNYTLPPTFGGQYIGEITYAADTNQGISLKWRDEVTIRQWREDVTDETGDPYWAAVRPMTRGQPRRRWELLLYPKPDEVMGIEFPYILHFDRLVDLDEVPPAPIGHDEAIKAACRAMVEKDQDGVPGPEWEYYRQIALPNSHRVDALSAPKRLGYFGNPSGAGPSGDIRDFRKNWYDRPTVGFNGS